MLKTMSTGDGVEELGWQGGVVNVKRGNTKSSVGIAME